MDGALISQCAGALRELLRLDLETSDDFIREVRRSDALDPLLQLLNELRANRRSRLRWDRAVRRLRGTDPLRPKLRSLLQNAFLVYQIFRLQAFPVAGRSSQATAGGKSAGGWRNACGTLGSPCRFRGKEGLSISGRWMLRKSCGNC